MLNPIRSFKSEVNSFLSDRDDNSSPIYFICSTVSLHLVPAHKKQIKSKKPGSSYFTLKVRVAL